MSEDKIREWYAVRRLGQVGSYLGEDDLVAFVLAQRAEAVNEEALRWARVLGGDSNPPQLDPEVHHEAFLFTTEALEEALSREKKAREKAEAEREALRVELVKAHADEASEFDEAVEQYKRADAAEAALAEERACHDCMEARALYLRTIKEADVALATAREEGAREALEHFTATWFSAPEGQAQIDADHDWALWGEKWQAAIDLMGSQAARANRAEDALRSIASNTCCGGCQEAANVAARALIPAEPAQKGDTDGV